LVLALSFQAEQGVAKIVFERFVVLRPRRLAGEEISGGMRTRPFEPGPLFQTQLFPSVSSCGIAWRSRGSRRSHSRFSSVHRRAAGATWTVLVVRRRTLQRLLNGVYERASVGQGFGHLTV
jgi:hypothetical protein